MMACCQHNAVLIGLTIGITLSNSMILIPFNGFDFNTKPLLVNIRSRFLAPATSTWDTYNFGIGNSICKHGLKLCGSLLYYLGGAMINLCGSLLPDRAWRCFNFRNRFSSVQSLWCCTGLTSTWGSVNGTG